MRIRVSAFIVGKTEAVSIDECQDAIWARAEALPQVGCDTDFGSSCQDIGEHEIDCTGDYTLRFAVADGVTTAFYSGSWARLLVTQFGGEQFSIWEPDQFLSWQEVASQAWIEYMNSEERQLGTTSQNRLYERDPAASTFCGIEIRGGESESIARWQARVIGDSCVFHLTREGSGKSVLYSYPYESAAEFSRATKALTSYTPQDARQFPETELKQPLLREGDLLILATDALSEWMLKMHENGQPVWRTIAELNGQETFGSLIANARRESDATRHLKDDDVALIVISAGDESLGPLHDAWVYEPGDLLPPYVPSTGPSEFDKFLESLIVPAVSAANECQGDVPAATEIETEEENQGAEASPKDADEAGGQLQVKSTARLKGIVISLAKPLYRIGHALKAFASKLHPKSKARKPAAQAEANP